MAWESGVAKVSVADFTTFSGILSKPTVLGIYFSKKLFNQFRSHVPTHFNAY